jgi:hypothetical protein
MPAQTSFVSEQLRSPLTTMKFCAVLLAVLLSLVAVHAAGTIVDLAVADPNLSTLGARPFSSCSIFSFLLFCYSAFYF